MGFESQATQFLHQEIWISIHREDELYSKIGKNIYKNLQYGARCTVRIGSHRTGQSVQSDMNLHKAGKLVGCNIVYVMILIICNSIITRQKKIISMWAS